MTGGTLSDSDRTTLFFSTTVTGVDPTISISGGTIEGDLQAISTEFVDQIFVDLSGNPTIKGELYIYNNGTASDAVFRLNSGFEPADTVSIVFNSMPADGYVPVAVASGAESELEHISPILRYSGNPYFLVYKDGDVSLVRGVTLTFKTALTNGNELAEVEIIPGESIPYDEIKDKLVVEDRAGYYYRWVDSGTNKTINLETYTVPDDGKYSRTIYPYYYLENPEVSLSADKTGAVIGDVTLTATISNKSDALTYTYAWYKDGTLMQAADTADSITVSESGSYHVQVTVTNGKKTLSSSAEPITVTIVPTVTVTFMHGGQQHATAEVPAGGTLESIPAVPAYEGVGYHYVWVCEDGNQLQEDTVFENDAAVSTYRMLDEPTIEVSVSGPLYDGSSVTVTVTATHPLGDAVSYTYVYGEVGASQESETNATGVFTISEPGTYLFVVRAECGEDMSVMTETLGIESAGEDPGSELPPFIPFPPEQGGDPVEVGPIDQGSGSSDDGNDTLKTVAVAAAAVIAAILIIVWASTYRKD